MLWIFAFVVLVVGVLFICNKKSSKRKIFLAISLIFIECITFLTLAWCYVSPIPGSEVNRYNVTDSEMYVTKKTVTFSGLNETFSYTLRDADIGYTKCVKTDDSISTVIVCNEKYSLLKFILSFKPEQNIVSIIYNDGNKIIPH